MATAVTAVLLGTRVSGGVATANRRAVTAITSGVYAAGAPYKANQNIDQETDVNLKAWLPPQRVRLVGPDGLMTWEWYRFFQYVANKRLGGPVAPSITDLSTNVIAAKTDAATANANTAALAVQTKTNAEALEVTRQVVVNNSLAGAAQIPPVDRDFTLLEQLQ